MKCGKKLKKFTTGTEFPN